jgi:hypothetical protein
MRQVLQSLGRSSTPPPRWHDAFDEPDTQAEIEVDLGDCRVWRGVHYAPEIEAFVDDDSGTPIRVCMWRYAPRPSA